MREVDRSLYAVAVVGRVSLLLQALMENGPSTMAELAATVGCTRMAAFRLLRTLEATGHVSQDGRRGKWRLGHQLVALGTAATAQHAQERASLGLMLELAQITGENVALHRRDGLEAVTLALAPAAEAIRVYTGVGERRGLHAAHGRLLLAFAPERVHRHMAIQRLPRYASRTPVDPRQVLADAMRVRHRGWLISNGELDDGEVTISVPVRDAAGSVLALAIAAPATRLGLARARELVGKLEACAGRLSELLGGGPKPRID